MSSEIKLSVVMLVANGYLRDQFVHGTLVMDQDTPGRAGHAQLIGTTEEVIDTGDLVAPRWCAMRNLDPTNYIEVGPEQTTYGAGSMVVMLRLLPGEVAVFPLAPGVVLRGQAHTAPAKLDVHVYET